VSGRSVEWLVKLGGEDAIKEDVLIMLETQNGYVEFEGGARRSSKVVDYNRIEKDILVRLGEALTLGKEKYPDDPDGTPNWMKGGVDFAWEVFNHLQEHLWEWKADIEAGRDHEEDHLGHATANLMFLMWFERNGIFTPEMQRFERSLETDKWIENTLVSEDDNPPDVKVAEEISPLRKLMNTIYKGASNNS
jgi:hypothetical protein